MRLNEIQEERRECEVRQVQIYRAAEQEDHRQFTVEETEEVNRLQERISELDGMREDVQREQARTICAEREQEIAERNARPAFAEMPEPDSVSARMDRFVRDTISGRATLTTTDGDGQAAGLIPTDLAPSVVELLDRVSVMRQVATVSSVQRAMNVPRQTAYVDQTDGNETLTAEGATFNAADIHYGSINASTFEAKETGKMEYTDEMAEDSAFDIGAFMLRGLAEQIAHKQENQFCNGDGSSKPQGIFGTISGVNTYDAQVASGALTVDKIIKAILNGLPPQYMGLPRYLVVGQAAAAAILSDSSDGRLLLQQQAQATGANMPSYEVLGTRIMISSRAPVADANGECGAVILTEGSYMIQDIAGGMRVTNDIFTGSDTGVRKLNAYHRYAGFVARPQSIVQITM